MGASNPKNLCIIKSLLLLLLYVALQRKPCIVSYIHIKRNTKHKLKLNQDKSIVSPFNRRTQGCYADTKIFRAHSKICH